MHKLLITMALSLAVLGSAFAASTPEQIKTLFIFNFIKYIEWDGKPAVFTIGYVGKEDNLFLAFKEMAEKKSTVSQKIEIKIISSAAASDFHMIYIPEGNSDKLSQIPDSKNTVIITEKDGLAKKGSFINFINQEGKLRFEINKDRFSNSNVKVSSQLLSLAIVV